MHSISSRLLSPADVFGHEVSLRVYREEEAYSAAGLPISHDLECALDGRGGDTHLVSECALIDLDRNTYHLSAHFSFASPLRSPGRTITPGAGSFYQENVPGDRVGRHQPKGGAGGGDLHEYPSRVCANLVYPPAR